MLGQSVEHKAASLGDTGVKVKRFGGEWSHLSARRCGVARASCPWLELYAPARDPWGRGCGKFSSGRARVAGTFLFVAEWGRGGLSCPPEPIRVASARTGMYWQLSD